MEEWSQPGRHIHFAEGAHNRGWLLASGTSALALQVDVLRRGLDVLETLGVKRMGVAGASGGAVQAFYTAWLDSRIQALAMVSVPRIPREAAAGGCACDQVPGHPGPDPSVLASVKQPLLWLSEVQQDRPEGLAETAAFVVSAGPHSYTADMQKRTLDWFEEHLGLSAGPWVQSVPGYDLSTGLEGTAEAMPISQLPVQSEPQWSPNVQRGGAYTVECQGDGPVVVVLGRASTDALLTAGFSVCSVSVPVPPGVGHDELALAKSIGTGKVRAESIAGAVQAAAGAHGAVAVWGHRAWGVVAAMTGLPFVVEDPVLSFDDLDPAVDAPWVHVPGAWTGAIDRLLSQSLASGEEPSVLVSAISRVRD